MYLFPGSRPHTEVRAGSFQRSRSAQHRNSRKQEKILNVSFPRLTPAHGSAGREFPAEQERAAQKQPEAGKDT